MRELAGHTVIVTGASRGLGLYIARKLAKEKMNLVLVARTANRLAALEAELRAQGVKVLAIPADLTSHEDLTALEVKTTREFGAIDVLVNNAGIINMFPYHKRHAGDIEREIRVNLIAPMILSWMVLPGMLKRKRGHIVNVSSLAGKTGPPFDEAYGATKAALIAFTKSLRNEYHGTGVSSSVICPGYVKTGMYQDMKEKTGIVAPSLVGACSPESVANALVRAIKQNIPEIIVNTYPARPLTVLLELFPSLGERILRGIGAHAPFIKGAEANEKEKGIFPGINPMAPK